MSEEREWNMWEEPLTQEKKLDSHGTYLLKGHYQDSVTRLLHTVSLYTGVNASNYTWMMKILAPPISAKKFFLHAQFPRERKVIYFFSSLSSSLATARYEIQHRSLITMKRFLLIRELPGTKCKLTNRECT